MRGYGSAKPNNARGGERRFASRSFSDASAAEERDFYTSSAEKTGIPRGRYDPGDFRRRGYYSAEERKRSEEDRQRRGMDEARHKAASRRRTVRYRRGIILAAVIILVTLAFFFGLYKLVFVVRSVSVEGESRYGADRIVDASGLGKGTNLYSFRASATCSRITFECPYIEKVEVKRNVPSSVTLTVTEDKAAYYAEIFGRTKILSDGLRVLETLSDGEAVPDGLVMLKLPGISYSVEGRLLRFAGEKDERGIRATLNAAAESALAGRIGVIDFRDPFAIKAQCDGKYMLMLGSSTEIETKFKAAAKVLEDPMFESGNKARLELSDVTKTSVVFDNSIEFD